MFTTRKTEIDQERKNRLKDLSLLCQHAFQPGCQISQNLKAVCDQEIEILWCVQSIFDKRYCIGYVPLLHEASRHPLIVFKDGKASNKTIYETIERGQCPCWNDHKERLVFLPACAAAAAGNIELCRYLLWSFYQSDNHRVRQWNTSTEGLDRIHSLFEHVIHHLVYFGHGEEALRILEDLQIPESASISNDSKLSFMKTALAGGHHDTFRLLVDRFGVNIKGRLYGPTPLFLAVEKGTVSTARELLQKGADRDLNKRLERNGMDIVRAAIARDVNYPEDSDEMAIMLLEESLGQSYPQDLRNPSLLRAAITQDRYALVNYLLEKGHVTVPVKVPVLSHAAAASWPTMQTTLVPVVSWCCVFTSNQLMARYLVYKGLDCVSPLPLGFTVAFSYNRTPLQAIAERKCADQTLIELLIEHGADVNEKTLHGETPLELAMATGNISTVKTLLSAGAILDSPTLTDNERLIIREYRKGGKHSFLWHAVEHKEYNMAEMALAAGYRARREPWFVNSNFPTDTPQDVIEKLERLSLQPLSLKCLSRRTLKESVGSSLLTFLRQVDLGPIFDDDILLKDLIKMYKIE